jgi:CheY-like chemotaxis protein
MPPKKILLAEDDSDDQMLFYEFLHHRTDIVLMPVVENGVTLFDSLELIDNNKDLPDLIILDQNMPKRNGIQTLELLKEDKRYSHIPIMVYSTYTDNQLVQSCTKIGALSVVTKPLSKEGYQDMMDAFLRVINE